MGGCWGKEGEESRRQDNEKGGQSDQESRRAVGLTR